MCYDFIHPEMLRFCILLSQVGLCLMRNFSPPPTHPSFIFLYPPPLLSPTSSSVPDEPGQLKIYLPKKLLECLPKCSSLPKERHRWNTNEVRMRHAREGNIRDSEANFLLVTHLSLMSHWEMKRRQTNTMAAFHYGTSKLWRRKIRK